MTPPTILVPLDGTAEAAVALPVARTLGEVYGATLQIVHIGSTTLTPSALAEKLGLTPEELRGVVIDQVAGRPATRIVQLANERGSRFIVLCTQAIADRPSGALGHVAQEVICETSSPVVLVPPERGMAPWRLREVLMPHDGTPATAVALAPAAQLAAHAQARLIVLHVAAPGTAPPAEPGTMGAPRYVDQPQHEWSTWADEFLERLVALCGCTPAVTPQVVLCTGDPGAEVVRVARERGSDLIVLAWRGHPEEGRGETVKTVVRGAPCPVCVVRVEP
ncbi:MAG TPA: universal stress protein [Gemmatimonadaceae bacterium]|nr:universal stress protein [Gemmatimonadaceae bacterium]